MQSDSAGLSIIIAAWTGNTALQKCLDSLVPQASAASAEVIVVSNFDVELTSSFGADGAEGSDGTMQFVRMPDNSTVPQLRSAGVENARGAIVAMSEDFARFEEGWCSAILDGHSGDMMAVGGAIDNAPDSKLIDWAVYFVEYGRYMGTDSLQSDSASEDSPRTVSALTGLNVSYSRSVLERLGQPFQEEFECWKFHQTLVANNIPLRLANGARIVHARSYSFSGAAVDFFHHGRSLAGSRFSNAQVGKRIVYGFGAFILPLLMTGRVFSWIVSKRRCLTKLLNSSPLIFGLTVSWALGELFGYLSGAGRSSDNWR
jgi:GT2 family glycosyltransferase